MRQASDVERDRCFGAIRAFNRFYTRQIGLLQERLHQSAFSLAEARVLYELGQRPSATATTVAKSLDLDAGYLSRMIAKFVGQKLVAKSLSAADRRQYELRLTSKGRAAFMRLDRESQDQVAAMIGDLTRTEIERMIGAMRTIEGLLAPRGAGTPYLLRPHRAGDMGWVLARHGELYAQEYRWDMNLEATVAEIVGAFVRDFDPARERCWIAEIDGEPVGSVFLVKESDEVAKLRLLLVEPRARGLGIGRRLVEECVLFARQSGYKTVTLWTHSILTGARRIYERAGFRRVAQKRHHNFGQEVTGETWELVL